MMSQVLPTNVPSKNRADLLRLAARMTEEAEKIGRRMAERRKELGLTQRGVAERMLAARRTATSASLSTAASSSVTSHPRLLPRDPGQLRGRRAPKLRPDRLPNVPDETWLSSTSP